MVFQVFFALIYKIFIDIITESNFILLSNWLNTFFSTKAKSGMLFYFNIPLLTYSYIIVSSTL